MGRAAKTAVSLAKEVPHAQPPADAGRRSAYVRCSPATRPSPHGGGVARPLWPGLELRGRRPGGGATAARGGGERQDGGTVCRPLRGGGGRAGGGGRDRRGRRRAGGGPHGTGAGELPAALDRP